MATIGVVNPENCALALRDDLIGASTKILELLVTASQQPSQAAECIAETIRLAERCAQVSTPRRLLDALFMTFSKEFFGETAVAYTFSDHEAASSLFLKWTKVQQIPVDALPLFLMEMLDLLPGRTAAIATPEKRGAVMQLVHAVKPVQAVPPAGPDSDLSTDELDMLVGGVI